MPIYKQEQNKEQNICSQKIINGNVKLGEITGYSRHDSLKSDGITTIQQTEIGPVLSISESNGCVVLELSEEVEPPATIKIKNADWKIGKSFFVYKVDGNTAYTTSKFFDCHVLSGGETACKCEGELDPISNYDSEILSENICITPIGDCVSNTNIPKNNILYTECWECFDGELDPCTVECREVTWWEDESLLNDNVSACDGEKIISSGDGPVGSDNIQNRK